MRRRMWATVVETAYERWMLKQQQPRMAARSMAMLMDVPHSLMAAERMSVLKDGSERTWQHEERSMMDASNGDGDDDDDGWMMDVVVDDDDVRSYSNRIGIHHS